MVMCPTRSLSLFEAYNVSQVKINSRQNFFHLGYVLRIYNLKYILVNRPTLGESYFPFRALLISRLKKAYAKGFIAEFRTNIGILYAKSLLHCVEC